MYCLKKFGIINFIIRWFQLIFSVLGMCPSDVYLTTVLVLGGVVPWQKIGHTSNTVLPYSGIYTTAGATRFTIFAVRPRRNRIDDIRDPLGLLAPCLFSLLLS